ncbi:MAG: hypothetical protein PHU46_10090 [Rhodocyclaceae bacterium]|nr:hypothetical protein [Rhodocyclaceae bacterium]
MEYLYILGLIPAAGAYLFARSYYAGVKRRFRLPSSVMDAHFLPHLVGWGTAAVILWFFGVAFVAQATDPQRIMLLLLMPCAFAAGELFGVFMWQREIHEQMTPRQLSRAA